MIKGLHSTSPSVIVGQSLVPNVYPTHGASLAGQIRYNISTQTYEIYDGSMWQVASTSLPVGLTMDAEEAIEWAKRKMREEADLKDRMERHPGLKDAWEKFQLMDLLTKEADEQSL